MAAFPTSSTELFAFIQASSSPVLTRDSEGDVINTSQPLTGAALSTAIAELVKLVQVERAQQQDERHLDVLKRQQKLDHDKKDPPAPGQYH